MKKRKVILLFFLLAGLASQVCAQEILHAVTGKVTDQLTHAPVGFAVVYLPDLNRSTTADENGFFRLNDLPGTAQKFTFIRVGYRQQSMLVSFTDTLTNIQIELEPGNREQEEVVIIASPEHSSTSTIAVSQRSLRSRGALSISDGVSKLPGITQLSTGAGISKPVIRGLYGNRIQTIVMGMRFDNQQWQDEHGLGIQDIGVDRVELIKGPAALMYGSEAMGGVINIIEEKPANSDSVQADASMRLFSNTFGAGLDAGVRSAKNNRYWRIRVGADSHADYADGNNKRILNSRFDSYVGKVSYGFTKKKWSTVNNYVFSKSDFGFIMDTASVLVADERISRNFSQPHHTVYINLFTSQNTFFASNGDLFRITVGGHINRRMEDEGGGGISLDMQLITASAHFQYEHILKSKINNQKETLSWTLLSGIQSQVQDNKNLGWRIIVPDANMGEASFYSYVKRNGPRSVFEAGIRYDFRFIKTYETGNLNSGQYAIPAVSKLYQAINGSSGISVELIKDLRLKVNITSGYRSPNLAELSSSGVHEGTLRYEIGDPQMKIEQNFCAEAGLAFETDQIDISVTAYNNRFLNYIYLQPTNGDYFGFRIYRYLQTNATLQGGEFCFDWTPVAAKWLDLSLNGMMIRAKTDNGNYLPFIPADRIDGTLKFEIGDFGKCKDVYLRAGSNYYFSQNHPGQFETATGDYTLLDAGAGANIKLNRGKMISIDICCNNLLNKVYYDHLSRFKEFEIYNMGRNSCLNLKYEW